MNVTIKMIAQKAGVSIGTVDRALNDRAEINPQTKERILQVAKDLGYQTNVMARALSTKRSAVEIAVVLFPLHKDIFTSIHEGILAAEAELAHYGLKLTIFEMQDLNADEQLRILDMISAKQFAGIAISPVDHQAVKKKLNALEQGGLPIVMINTDLVGVHKLCFVGQNLYASGCIAAQLSQFILRPKESVALLGYIPEVRSMQERLSGFQDYMDSHGGRISYVGNSVLIDEHAEEQLVQILQHDSSIHVICLLSAYETQIIAGVLQRSQTAHNISLICFDNTPDHVDMLRNGEISFLITQNPYTQGYESILTLFNYLYFHITPKQNIKYTKTEILIPEMLKE